MRFAPDEGSDDELIHITVDSDDTEVDISERIRGPHESQELEDIHASLSKRDAIRSSLSSARSSFGSSTTTNRNSRHRRASSSSEIVEKEKQSSHSRRPPTASKRSTNDSLNEFSSSSIGSKEDGEKNNVSQRRRRYSRGRTKLEGSSRAASRESSRAVSRERSSDAGRKTRSPSTIKKLLDYDGDYTQGIEKNPLHRGLVRSRDNSNGRGVARSRSHASGRKHRTVDRRRRESSTDDARGRQRGKSTDDGRGRQRSSSQHHRPSRRSSSQQHGIGHSNRKHSSDRRNSDEDRTSKPSQSLHSMRTFQRKYEAKGDDSLKRGDTEDTFEKLWSDDSPRPRIGESATDHIRHHSSFSSLENEKERTYHGTYRTSSGPMDASVTSRTLDGSHNSKKTKLEKIHELQAKLDRYKAELRRMSESRSRYKRELEESESEVTSLRKELEDRDVETTTLKNKLSEMEGLLDNTKAEQRMELSKLSDAAKDLAQVNIDYAKSVDEARSIKTELDHLKDKETDQQKQIDSLEEKLLESNENARNLEADIAYADEQIDKLEDQVKVLEAEVAAYREAAEKDAASSDSATDNLREAKHEAEKKRLEEQNRIMEEQRNAFEAEKRRYLEEQKKRERELEEQQLILQEQQKKLEERQAQESETLRLSEEDRHRREDETREMLKTLEDENAALKGRLKSEQLDSNMKLDAKESTIAELENKVAMLTAEKEERNSSPDNPATLAAEVQILKEDLSKATIDLEDAHMKTLELQNEVNDLQISNREMTGLVSTLEVEVLEQKKEVENHKRKTIEWQKKSGEWSDKAHQWKEKAESWEKKARDSMSESHDDEEAVAMTHDPQALFLAAAVEKKAVNTATANSNGTWRFGQRIFGKPAETDDEAQAMMAKLEAENSMKANEIKTLKSEMVKLQTNFKEQAYNRTQEIEKLQREKDAIEQDKVNLLSELQLARKLNQTISDSST